MKEKTKRECYFYDWGGTGRLFECNAYSTAYGARCDFFNQFFSEKEGTLTPNCETCDKFVSNTEVKKKLKVISNQKEKYLSSLGR